MKIHFLLFSITRFARGGSAEIVEHSLSQIHERASFLLQRMTGNGYYDYI